MNANDLRPGAAIKFNGEIFIITEFHHHTPGNKRAFIQATMQSLKSGKIFTQRFSSTATVEEAHLDSRKAQYQYHDINGYHFMDLEDYSTITLSEQALGDKKYYLKENDEVTMEFHEGNPMTVEIPNQVFLKVTDSPPGIRGDSVSNNTKSAILETGLKIQVPIFIQEGTIVKVNTRTGEYLGKQ